MTQLYGLLLSYLQWGRCILTTCWVSRWCFLVNARQSNNKSSDSFQPLQALQKNGIPGLIPLGKIALAAQLKLVNISILLHECLSFFRPSCGEGRWCAHSFHVSVWESRGTNSCFFIHISLCAHPLL